MNDSKEGKSEAEKTPIMVFKKTFKFFWIPVFSVENTVTEKEFCGDVKEAVLKDINAELNKKFNIQPKKP